MGDNYMIYVFNRNNRRNAMSKFAVVSAQALSHFLWRALKMET